MVPDHILIGTNQGMLKVTVLHQITIGLGFCLGKYGNEGSGGVGGFPEVVVKLLKSLSFIRKLLPERTP